MIRHVVFLFVASVAASAAPLFTETFDDISRLSGWAIINNSTPGGQTPEGWFQGTGTFLTPDGSPTSYIQANFENAGTPGDISTWLLSPTLDIRFGDQLTFSTIGENVPGFPDRLEIRYSRSGSSTNVGTTPQSVGDFTELLLVVNPDLMDAGYPVNWTPFNYTFSAAQAGNGRIAFRYHVPDRTQNGSTIALDYVAFVPEPGAGILSLIAILFLAVCRSQRLRSRKRASAVVLPTALLISFVGPNRMESAEAPSEKHKRRTAQRSAKLKPGTGLTRQQVHIDPITGLPEAGPSKGGPAVAGKSAPPAPTVFFNLPNGAVGRVTPTAELEFLTVEQQPDGSLRYSHQRKSATTSDESPPSTSIRKNGEHRRAQ